MKKRSFTALFFAGKSMLWAVLLYATCMFAFNWDEMSAGFKQYRAGTILNTQPVAAADSVMPNADHAKRSVISAAIKIGIEEIAKAITGYNK